MAQILTSLRIAALLGLAFAAPAAAAEGRSCAQREKVVARLAERFGETLQSIGLSRSAAWWRSTLPRRPAPGRFS